VASTSVNMAGTRNLRTSIKTPSPIAWNIGIFVAMNRINGQSDCPVRRVSERRLLSRLTRCTYPLQL
jgi:hypothetical protein